MSTLGDSATIPLLVLPTESSIQFTQASSDVIHSFFVPEFLFKRDVFPLPEKNNQDNVWQIDQIDRQGTFVGRCAELCGTYHSQMNFEVRALPLDLFNRWLDLRGQVNPATGEATPPARRSASSAAASTASPPPRRPFRTTPIGPRARRPARSPPGTEALT